jgi:hypothetical protein
MLALIEFSKFLSFFSHIDVSVIHRTVMHAMDLGFGGWV